MDRAELLELVEALGNEFERRGMRRHVEALRTYYLAVRQGLDREHTGHSAWTEDMTVEWMALLRLPPYQAHYQVRDAAYRCQCEASTTSAKPTGQAGDWSHIGKGTAATEAVFPDGYKSRCSGCGAAWIVLTEGSTAEGPSSASPSLGRPKSP